MMTPLQIRAMEAAVLVQKYSGSDEDREAAFVLAIAAELQLRASTDKGADRDAVRQSIASDLASLEPHFSAMDEVL